ncbi:hypothetical protein BZA05DRAFT_179192 [Tricharina praecox]|uniref:uncharacterized protein n=1 Tax=Tricharina praecox TaxID=43433 RepID=UPI00221EF88F|nr:uncharacterized protein BZA05DRAFT_179192 [Tricharina praecox]KAI5843682.1 hypothetical protein BZA05DRAFT_179192 [Tricharina praecox]
MLLSLYYCVAFDTTNQNQFLIYIISLPIIKSVIATTLLLLHLAYCTIITFYLDLTLPFLSHPLLTIRSFSFLVSIEQVFFFLVFWLSNRPPPSLTAPF